MLAHYRTSFDLSLWDPSENCNDPPTLRHIYSFSVFGSVLLVVLMSMDLNAIVSPCFHSCHVTCKALVTIMAEQAVPFLHFVFYNVIVKCLPLCCLSYVLRSLLAFAICV